MPSASPSEVSTHPGQNQGFGLLFTIKPQGAVTKNKSKSHDLSKICKTAASVAIWLENVIVSQLEMANGPRDD